MEIAPISGIRFMPTASRPRVAEVSAPVFDIEDLARIESHPEYRRQEQAFSGMGNGYEDLLQEEDEEYMDAAYAPYMGRQVGRRLNCIA